MSLIVNLSDEFAHGHNPAILEYSASKVFLGHVLIARPTPLMSSDSMAE
jgi:hypothetical protein